MKAQFRFIIYIADRECKGEWREFILADFLKDCEAWAVNDTAFLAEFRQG